MSNDTDTHDEVPVPHLQERLWSELAQLHAARNQSGQPDPNRRPDQDGPPARDPQGDDGDRTAPVRSLRSAAWRQPARRSLLVGAAAVAAGAAIVVGIVVTGSDDGSSPGGAPSTSGPAADIGARVVAATQEAGRDSVMHTVTRWGTGRTYEEWADRTSRTYRRTTSDASGTLLQEEGGPVTWYGDESDPPGEARSVVHCTRTYEEGFVHGTDDVSGIWEGLADGSLVEDGTEVIDGQELLRLRPTDDPEGGTVAWIDPATHRLVRFQHPSGRNQVTITFDYLPRTPELLDRLAPPPVPDGYDQVEPGESSTSDPEDLLELGPGPLCPD